MSKRHRNIPTLGDHIRSSQPSRRAVQVMVSCSLILSWAAIFNLGRLVGIGFPDSVYVSIIVPALAYNWAIVGSYIMGQYKDLRAITDAFDPSAYQNQSAAYQPPANPTPAYQAPPPPMPAPTPTAPQPLAPDAPPAIHPHHAAVTS